MLDSTFDLELPHKLGEQRQPAPGGDQLIGSFELEWQDALL